MNKRLPRNASVARWSQRFGEGSLNDPWQVVTVCICGRCNAGWFGPKDGGLIE